MGTYKNIGARSHTRTRKARPDPPIARHLKRDDKAACGVGNPWMLTTHTNKITCMRCFRMRNDPFAEATCVVITGPEPEQNYRGDEIPVWLVFQSDDEGDTLGTEITARTHEAAIQIGAELSRKHGLELINESTAAGRF